MGAYTYLQISSWIGWKDVGSKFLTERCGILSPTEGQITEAAKKLQEYNGGVENPNDAVSSAEEWWYGLSEAVRVPVKNICPCSEEQLKGELAKVNADLDAKKAELSTLEAQLTKARSEVKTEVRTETVVQTQVVAQCPEEIKLGVILTLKQGEDAVFFSSDTDALKTQSSLRVLVEADQLAYYSGVDIVGDTLSGGASVYVNALEDAEPGKYFVMFKNEETGQMFEGEIEVLEAPKQEVADEAPKAKRKKAEKTPEDVDDVEDVDVSRGVCDGRVDEEVKDACNSKCGPVSDNQTALNKCIGKFK